jgi:hypothetical protein
MKPCSAWLHLIPTHPARACLLDRGRHSNRFSRYLSKVRIESKDPAEQLAHVDGGAIWETVDKAMVGHGLATAAATVNHVSSFR